MATLLSKEHTLIKSPKNLLRALDYGIPVLTSYLINRSQVNPIIR